MSISMILDIIISVLLVLTIAYAVRLNQRLSQLRSDKNELLQLAKTFAEATLRAEAGIEKLKVSTTALGAEVEKAEALKDDLAYLVDRGGKTADEMVDSVRTTKAGRPEKTSPGSIRNSTIGAGFPSEKEDDARLIETAILAATPGIDENRPSQKGQKTTRRIAGGMRPARKTSSFDRSFLDEQSPLNEQRLPSSRDLGADAEGEGSIGDTPAARELLKALGSSDS